MPESTKNDKKLRPDRMTGVFEECRNCGYSMYVQKSKIGKKKYCSRECQTEALKNNGHFKRFSEMQKKNNVATRKDVKKKMSDAKIKYYAAGNKPWNYIDGSSRNRKYTKSKWIKLAKKIYERDNYECQKCGKHGGILNAHHIMPWSGNEELRFNEDNLITLCVPCHAKEHYNKKNYGDKLLNGQKVLQ